MLINKPQKLSIRLVLFLFSFWAIGVIFAIFYGLGWFFLIESIRRLITYIPPLNRIIQDFLVGKEDHNFSEMQSSTPNVIFLSKILRLIIFLGWVGITIFVFAKVNIPLIEIFQSQKP
jgi:hypothetical protein